MVGFNPAFPRTPQEPRRGLRDSGSPDSPAGATEPVEDILRGLLEHEGDEGQRSDFYRRMMLIQASPALRDASPSTYRLAVSVAMLAKPDLFASITTLERHTGLARRTVQKAIKALEAIGLLDAENAWKRHDKGGGAASWTRLRKVRWEALGTEAEAHDTLRRTGSARPDTPPVHAGTPPGVHAPTPQGVHAGTPVSSKETRGKEGSNKEEDTSLLVETAQLNSEAAGTPTPEGDPQAGLEGGDSQERTEPEGTTGATETESGSRSLAYEADLQVAKDLHAIGLSPQVAALYVHAAGRGILRRLLVKIEAKDASNPAGLLTTLLKDEAPDTWRRIQEQRQREKAVRKGRSPSRSVRRKHPSGCTCEDCFSRVTAMGA